ncbi:hypothetical protein R69608_07517 [Paraburkholderia nemoris]|uniref:hypothetical protein n=1 Tax=Paraburkholderia nemoris TaxID=2793076 RepID=UPI0019124E0D|nr:hypothetical protein [Paraburkholderia nemoris]MBK5153035.1 hypothetical protein [Burkholderia sp. R-69608]CAE6971227.1 hypothetical protein R69608_07517 [Paraburkholderia nemoris]
MPEWMKRIRPRGHCWLGLSRETVAVRHEGASRRSTPMLAEAPLPDLRGAAPDTLAVPIAAALAAAGGNGLPVYATLADNLVRYFIVTPPDNSARMQDLRAAATVRFQLLYGETISAWQLVADWQVTTPFLACAVSRRITTALQLAVSAERGCLVSLTPNFVAAWNGSRQQLRPDAWLATLADGALTFGLVANAAKPRLAAVRTLTLPEEAPPVAWLREQVARIALLDNLPAPSVLFVHGPRLDAWQPGAASYGETGMTVRWCASDNTASGPHGRGTLAQAQLARGGAAP